MKYLAFAVALFAAVAGGPAGAEPPGPTPDPLWTAYRDRFISSEGRLIDNSAENVSHSEGQGYGMLLAAFAGDRATSAKLGPGPRPISKCAATASPRGAGARKIIRT